MKFIIKPDNSSLFLQLESNQYSQAWSEHSRKLHKAFRAVTGLEFQQRTITARVFSGQQSDSGIPGDPMKLAGDYRSIEFKLATIVHELSHRLLGGNALDMRCLGLVEAGDEGAIATEQSHRLIYLFEYDVMRLALGEQWGVVCRQYEERGIEDGSDLHTRAWKWAMNLSFDQRQRAMKWLAAKKVERQDWEKFSHQPVKRITLKEWEAMLRSATA